MAITVMPVPLDPDAVPNWLSTLWPAQGRDPSIVAGVNDDDCAIMHWGDEFVVVTLDFLNAVPIAIQLGLGDLRELGRLLVAANLADLCGTGAEPRALLIGAMLEKTASEDDFRALVAGVQGECAKWGVPVVGGDTKLGSERALVGVAIGSAPSRDCLFLKNGGVPGDLLWCSGPLGSCNAAVLGLTHGSMSKDWQHWAEAAILVPKLPLAKSRSLSATRLGHAGIDVSDGLGADLKRLCDASNVGAVVQADKLPLESEARALAAEMKIEPWTLAFGCGGDFQFLVTTPRDAYETVSSLGFHLIGELTGHSDTLLQLPDGRSTRIPSGGHRDRSGLPFAAEILKLVTTAGKV